MKAKITFGSWEGTMMLLNIICTPLVLGFPREMLEVAGTGGWMIPIFITPLAVLLFSIALRLYKKFEGKDILDIAEIAAGKAGKFATGILLLVYLLFTLAIILREFAEDMKVIALLNSPISFVTMFFIIGMIVGCYYGIEPLVRFTSLTVPVIAAGYLFIVFGVAPHYDVNHLFPVLGGGTRSIFFDGFFFISNFSPILLLFLIAPFLKTYRNFKATGYASIIVSGILFFFGVFCYLLVYPYPISIENFLPIYHLARIIEYGRFFQRIESVFVLIWVAAAMSYLSIGFYFTIFVFRKTFELEYQRPLIWPFIIIIFTLSLITPNLMSVLELVNNYHRRFAWILSFCVPIIILLIARLRGDAGKKEAIRK